MNTALSLQPISDDFRCHADDVQCVVCLFVDIKPYLGATCSIMTEENERFIPVDRFLVRECSHFKRKK